MRTLIYEIPAADATHIEGTIESDLITQTEPVPFKAPIIKVNGVNDLEATIALINAIEDQTDLDIAERPELARAPMGPAS